MPQEVFEITMTYKTCDEFRREWENSYSKGMVFLKPDKKPSGRVRVKLIVAITETCGKVEFAGEVVHVSEHGVGLQLDPITESVKGAVEAALDAIPMVDDEECMPALDDEEEEQEVELEPDTAADSDDEWEEDSEVEEKGESEEDEEEEGDDEKSESSKEEKSDAIDQTNLSVFTRIQNLTRAEKAALARKGGMDERAVLMRDRDPYIIFAVMANPRITVPEIIAMTKSNSITLEMIKIILNKTEWMAVEEVRLNLVLNPKTPQPTAIQLLRKLSDKNVRKLAKRPIKQAIKSAALKIVIEKGGR